MDDQTFDQQTAVDWIGSIEKPGKTLRDDDIYPILADWIRNVSPKTILDIGCGQGICSEKVDLKGSVYTGVEPSPYLLDRAKELYLRKDRTFVLGNIYNLPFPDSSFEAAFSILVWHLLSDPRKAARELNRVLQKNGQFLLVTANPGAYDAWKELYTNAMLAGSKLEGTMRLDESLTRDVLYLHTLDNIRESLRNAGLEIHRTQTFRAGKNSERDRMLISIQGKKCS